MGLCNSPDIFQEKMSELMYGLEFARAYLDDLLVVSKDTFENHFTHLEEVFTRLASAGLKVNASKSFFAREGLEYLGYWISRDGIQPLTSKVEAIARIAPPKNKRELRRFIGIVNYYRDMWIRRSHVLAPLAKLTSKDAKWVWSELENRSFQKMKAIIAKETLLAYPDFNKQFEIHTDASHTQLGAVVSQDNRPIAFYSRKLNPAQTRYTTNEQELLSIVETLKEFRNILLGQQIVVFTDHLNLTCKTFNTERVMRWRLLLEEYSPEIRYIPGEHNIVADALSRLDLTNNEPYEQMSIEDIAELYADEEDDAPQTYPLSYAEIASEQEEDATIKRLMRKSPKRYVIQECKFSGTTYQLVTREDKIVLPTSMQRKAVEWYHQILCHPGETRTELTMGQHFCWKGMRNTVQDVCKRCPTCQINKTSWKKYGELPPKQAEVTPWKTLHIDTIGEYSIDVKVKGKSKTLKLRCLTMIDPATGWFEIAQLDRGRADYVADLLERVWFNRYPWPTEVICDRGKEFMAEVINTLRDDYGITRKPITTRNPQANAMVERAHQTLGNMLRTQNFQRMADIDLQDPFSGVLSAVGFAMRATVHTTTRATPSQLVFNRDAIHNINFKADWNYIKNRKQQLINKNNKRENATRIPHTYQVGDMVVIKADPNRKYDTRLPYSDPRTIEKVYANGTVKLRQVTPRGGALTQIWNLRNIKPYKV